MIVRPVVCRKFVGRVDELAFLHEQRLLAARSRGGMVLVAGDAGIGKSRLLAEFCGSLGKSRWKVERGASLEFAQRPYGPILDVLEACDGNGGTLLPAATKREQFDAIAERLARIAEKTSLIAILEDIHWADTATLELLTFLAGKAERMRVLLLASFRPHELGNDHPSFPALAKAIRAARSGRIDLAPLDEPALRLFIDEALSEYTLSSATRRAVAQTSEGNPFFIEELLKAAIERTEMRAADGEDMPLPSSIRSTLLGRFGLLSNLDRNILAQAAVIGRTFDLTLLAKTLAATIQDILPTLARARDNQLIEELTPTLFRFRHALTRRSIYAGFLGAQAQALHRTIAGVLEEGSAQERSLESLAYHWWAAGEGSHAARYNELAGDSATSVHAHEDAIAFYERALESETIEVWTRATIIEKVAERCETLTLMDRMRARYIEAADLFARSGDDEREAHCRVRAAISAYLAGNAKAMEPLEAMLDRLASNSYLARAQVHLGIAWLVASFWYPTEAARHLASVDERALKVGDIALRYHNVCAWVAMTTGDLEAFRREFALWIDAALQSGRRGVVASAYLNGASCHAMLGLHDEAIVHSERAVSLARAERNHANEQGAHSITAMCYLMTGDLLRAREALENVSASTENSITAANAAAIGTLVGAYLDDAVLMTRWSAIAGKSLLELVDADCGAGYAEVLVRSGKFTEARAALSHAIPTCERLRGNFQSLLAIAKYGSTNDLVPARAQLVASADSPAELVERHAIALFDAYVALREGHLEAARTNAKDAADGFERLRYPLLEAAAREVAGDYEHARAIFLRCGAVWDARRLLARHARGSSTKTRTAQAPSCTTLSKREFEIAALVARGKSNVEIGRELTISLKTVEKHLSSAYQKLGASSRVALAKYVNTGNDLDGNRAHERLTTPF